MDRPLLLQRNQNCRLGFLLEKAAGKSCSSAGTVDNHLGAREAFFGYWRVLWTPLQIPHLMRARHSVIHLRLNLHLKSFWFRFFLFNFSYLDRLLLLNNTYLRKAVRTRIILLQQVPRRHYRKKRSLILLAAGSALGTIMSLSRHAAYLQL